MTKRFSGLLAAALLATTATTGLFSPPAHAAPTDIVVNEVETKAVPKGDDWFELYNKGTAAVDVSGWRMLDNDDKHTPYVFPAGTSIPAGAYLVVTESQFGFGLGGDDKVRIWDATADITTAAPLAQAEWSTEAAGAWSRCPNGVGAWVDAPATAGALNTCPSTTPDPTPTEPKGPIGSVWPGPAEVTTVDVENTYSGDMSGLDFAADGSALWAVHNGSSLLFKLDPTTYAPMPGWEAGKAITYVDGTGKPDTEGITAGPDGKLYVATERNNADKKVSKIMVLELDPETMTTTREWDLTSQIPVDDANLGAEAIEWIPGSEFGIADVEGGVPGVFAVGIEGTGDVHVVQLGATAEILFTLQPGLAGVMALDYQAAEHALWVFCDDTCDGTALKYGLTGSRTMGGSYIARPAGMPNVNNEGVAIGACAPDGLAPVLYTDDNNTDGHSIRLAHLTCTYVAPESPEDPADDDATVGDDENQQQPPAQPSLPKTGGTTR